MVAARSQDDLLNGSDEKHIQKAPKFMLKYVGLSMVTQWQKMIFIIDDDNEAEHIQGLPRNSCFNT
jgi:hypothetical protein